MLRESSERERMLRESQVRMRDMPRESSSSRRGRGECEKAERTELSDEDRGKREEHTHVFAASCLVSRLRTELGKSQLLHLVASPNIPSANLAPDYRTMEVILGHEA